MKDLTEKEKYISSLEKQIQKKNETIHLLQTIEKSHQKLNGELQEKLSQYEDKAAHYRRKAVL